VKRGLESGELFGENVGKKMSRIRGSFTTQTNEGESDQGKTTLTGEGFKK